jgi:hypothetical protein
MESVVVALGLKFLTRSRALEIFSLNRFSDSRQIREIGFRSA